jgi:parallel beta-helix repeat protein
MRFEEEKGKLERKAVSGIMLALLLLLSMLTLTFNTQPVRATGTIYIRADGSIDPPTAPISTADNATYTFTDSINDSIVVERDDIVVDGASFRLCGVGSGIGIDLSGRANVTIKNTEIKAFECGLKLDETWNNTIVGNNITDNGYCGITLRRDSKYNSILKNNVSGSYYAGIEIFCGEGSLFVSGYNTVYGNSIKNNRCAGVWLAGAWNNSISGNSIVGDMGLFFSYSFYNSIVRNTLNNGERGAIVFDCSRENIVVQNNITNSNVGIRVNDDFSGGNKIYRNNFLHNEAQVLTISVDVWDDGYPSGGNYWSDYEGKYPNATEIYGSGIWNTPYLIDQINQDNYPLAHPYGSVQNLNTSLTYLTIQSAINAPETLNGHTIYVRNGTYYEIVDIYKDVSLVGENRATTTIIGSFPSSTVFLGGSNIVLSGFTLYSSYWFTIDLQSSSNNIITDNNIIMTHPEANQVGACITIQSSSNNNTVTKNNMICNGDGQVACINLYGVHSNKVIGNNITSPTESAIYVSGGASSNIISENVVDCPAGVNFAYGASGNLLTKNIIKNTQYCAICCVGSSNNLIYHNTFENNTQQVYSDGSINLWDDGYPSGGNYWSDYINTDLYSGLYQNETGSDGIWDNPYVIDGSNQDNYPFVSPWSPFENGTIYIRADGSVDPSGAPVLRKGDFYTLTGNINSDADGVVIERDNMTLDGAGYTLQGPGVYPTYPTGIFMFRTNNVTIKNMKIRDFNGGIVLKFSNYNNIIGNHVAACIYDGHIYLDHSSNNNIFGNNITDCGGDGISLYQSSNNSISGNSITYTHTYDIYLGSSSSNNITKNNMLGGRMGCLGLWDSSSNNRIAENNLYGDFCPEFFIEIYGSSNNSIFHNNLIHQLGTAWVSNIGSVNAWDDGYPSGGNYWSAYTGSDLYSGPYQNETGSDGIGDTPNNGWDFQDKYPLMNPWPSLEFGTADLSVSSVDIVFSDPNPSEGLTITISARIHNLGERNLKNINVRFFDGNTSIGEQQISFISHNSQGTASINWTAENEGFHLIKVVVDPDNIISEKDEENNEATRSVLVGEITQFGEIIITGSVSPNETSTGCSVIVQGYAEYNTTYGAGEPVAGAEVTITIIGWKQETTHTIKDGTYTAEITAPYTPGNYTIVVTVTDFTFSKRIEIELSVAQETGVDLTLSHHDISFSPPNPIENESIGITATIHNVGTESATNILVAFCNDDMPIENRTIDLILGGESKDITISWNATQAGWHAIKVSIDPENAIEELNENNNEASKNIYVYPPLPDLTPTNIDFSDSTPMVNQTITISATIRNIGGVQANDVFVSFYNGNQSIGNVTIPCISGKGDSRTASISYSFTVDGWHFINVTADIENNIPEIDERNNWYCENICVHLPSPDLTLSSLDITFSNSTPTIGDIITIFATVHNIGEMNATNVSVEFFDGDTRITPFIIIPLIPAGGQETVDTSWNATPVGWHRIKVIIDKNKTIPESNENNNVASRYVYVCPPPEEAADLLIYSEDIVLSNSNPKLGEEVIIYATVHNVGEAEAQNVTVLFYIDDIQVGSPKTMISIPVNGNETMSTKWIASQIGSHVVKVIADTPIESNKNNNEATKGIIVGNYDIAIKKITFSKRNPAVNETINIFVMVENQGNLVETFDLNVNCTLLFDPLIGSQTITLEPGAETTLNFTWTPTAGGRYEIKAYTSTIPNDINPSDNIRTAYIYVRQLIISGPHYTQFGVEYWIVELIEGKAARVVSNYY